MYKKFLFLLIIISSASLYAMERPSSSNEQKQPGEYNYLVWPVEGLPSSDMPHFSAEVLEQIYLEVLKNFNPHNLYHWKMLRVCNSTSANKQLIALRIKHGGFKNSIVIDNKSRCNTSALTDQQGLVASYINPTEIKLWNLKNGKCEKAFKTRLSGICIKAVDKRKQQIVVGCHSGSIRVFDSNTGTCLKTIQAHSAPINTIKIIDPDTKIIATGGDSPEIKIWDLNSGKCLQTLTGHTRDISCIKLLDKKNKTIASTSWDKTAKIWDINSGECLHTLKGHSAPIYSLEVIDPINNIIATGSVHNRIKIWNCKTGQLLQTLEGHSYPVSTITAIDPQCKFIASGTYSGTIKIWDWASGVCLHTMQAYPEFKYPKLKEIHLIDKENTIIAVVSGHGKIKTMQLKTINDMLAPHEEVVKTKRERESKKDKNKRNKKRRKIEQ